MADRTKRALALSLSQVLEKKPLDKITISDVTDHCGVNRQTFYYHFHDIYDLIEWIYILKANEAIGENRSQDNWEEGMLGMCQSMLKYKDFVLRTYHSRSGGHLAQILLQRSFLLLIGVVDEVADGKLISHENREFIANFYKYGFAGVIMEWLDRGMVDDPKFVVEKVEVLMKGTFPLAVERFSEMEQKEE